MEENMETSRNEFDATIVLLCLVGGLVIALIAVSGILRS